MDVLCVRVCDTVSQGCSNTSREYMYIPPHSYMYTRTYTYPHRHPSLIPHISSPYAPTHTLPHCTLHTPPQFRKVFQSCLNFVSGDLSSFYLDTAKDRLYIQARDSSSRRACQTVQAAVLQVRVVVRVESDTRRLH